VGIQGWIFAKKAGDVDMLFSWPSAGKDVIDGCASKTCGLEGRVESAVSLQALMCKQPVRLCGSDFDATEPGVNEVSQDDAPNSGFENRDQLDGVSERACEYRDRFVDMF
jgi:hypothetical protein